MLTSNKATMGHSFQNTIQTNIAAWLIAAAVLAMVASCCIT